MKVTIALRRAVWTEVFPKGETSDRRKLTDRLVNPVFTGKPQADARASERTNVSNEGVKPQTLGKVRS